MEVRRKKDGEEGVFVFLPFITRNMETNEASQINYYPGAGHGVLVNVGWVSLAEYKKNKLRNFRLPDPENFEIINNSLSKVFYFMEFYLGDYANNKVVHLTRTPSWIIQKKEKKVMANN
jgi:hypothetical protein